MNNNNHKISTVHSGLPEINEAIRTIAWRGIINPATQAPYSSRKTTGFVAKIHTEGALAGTVDVQEYISHQHSNANDKEGYHEGVYLTAMQNNNGMLIVPMLYSDVVIMKDPETHKEYVVMFSHVDIINLDSHQTISIGVKEREEFDPSEETELEDLEDTGAFSSTTYLKNKITTEVSGEKDTDPIRQTLDASDSKNPVCSIEVGASQSESPELHVKVGEDGLMDIVGGSDGNINIELKNKGLVNISDSKTSITNKSTLIKIDSTPGQETVYLGSDSDVDVAVLGNELADVLLGMLDALSQMMTTTMIGPQPPLNLASFIQLKVKIQTFKSMTSGFLTKKVKIQK